MEQRPTECYVKTLQTKFMTDMKKAIEENEIKYPIAKINPIHLKIVTNAMFPDKKIENKKI